MESQRTDRRGRSLGFMFADSEKEDSWRNFFKSLKVRGLSHVDLVVSDDHEGLVNAVAVESQGASKKDLTMQWL